MDRSTLAARGRIWVLLAGLIVLVLIAADVASTALPFLGPTPPRVAAVFGSGIGADSLANTQVGGTSCGCPNLRSSFRFVARHDGELEAIRIYVIREAEGYAAGTGGTIEATIQPDDGSPAHVPTDEVLARATVPSDDAFPRVEFEPAVPLVEGALYHVVFTNVDPAPTENFVSVNSLFVEPPITPRQAQYTDSEWAQLLDYGDGWELRPEYTPILQLEYSDGTFEGVGYMESWIEAAKTISGPARARESFDISGGDLTVDQAHIRLGRAEGEDPLIVRLETVDGRTLASGEVPAVRFPPPEDGEEPLSTWVTVTFDQPAVLVDRHRYHLVLETTPATEYVIHGIRKGSAVGFEPPTYFAEGVAEFDPGDGWVAFDPGWRGPLPQADLQFYLE